MACSGLVWIIGRPNSTRYQKQGSRKRQRLQPPPWCTELLQGSPDLQSGHKAIGLAALRKSKTYVGALTLFNREEELLFDYWDRRDDFISFNVKDFLAFDAPFDVCSCTTLAVHLQTNSRPSRSGAQYQYRQQGLAFPVQDWLLRHGQTKDGNLVTISDWVKAQGFPPVHRGQDLPTTKQK